MIRVQCDNLVGNNELKTLIQIITARELVMIELPVNITKSLDVSIYYCGDGDAFLNG